MRLLLIRPPFCVQKFYFPRPINEPLGIEYITAFTKQYHEVEMLDAVAERWNHYWIEPDIEDFIFQGLDFNSIIERVKIIKPDIIGLTWLFSTQNESVKRLAQHIKQFDPGIKIFAGGSQASTVAEEILGECNDIDVVVFGEGEVTVKELLDGKNLGDIDGIAYRSGGAVIKNKARELIKELDMLPLPYRDQKTYLNYSKQNLYGSLYFRLNKLNLDFNNKNRIARTISSAPYSDKAYFKLYNHKNRDKLPFADIVTSRGCPNDCSFCAVKNTWGRGWRMRSAESVLKEVDHLVKNFKVKQINFQDDNFNVHKQRTIDICRGIVTNRYDISIDAPAGAFVPSLDEEVLTWLKRAGMSILRLSVESGNQWVLDNIVHKKINLRKVREVVDLCRKVGIRSEGAFIIGMPGETIETMEETIEFAKKTGFDRVIRFIYQPFPNTELYEICKKNGYLAADYDPSQAYITGARSYIKTDKFSPEDVVRLARG